MRGVYLPPHESAWDRATARGAVLALICVASIGTAALGLPWLIAGLLRAL